MGSSTNVHPEAGTAADGAQGMQVAAGGAVPTPTDAAAQASVTDVIVAVHGIGDQYRYATIQTVVNRFCSYHRYPGAVPLGSFRTPDEAPFCMRGSYPSDPFGRYAFAEVYWANIPREIATERYTLEESKRWAHTIVERLRLRWQNSGERQAYSERDFRLIDQVLSEMIETIGVLDRIFLLADKAGLFKFDLRTLLDGYLGDVQIVTEFGSEREKILAAFDKVMRTAHRTYRNANIHIVAHSEGTVVAFLGLLRAFQAPEGNAGWATRVRGFMTLGSPIDKHLVLWPELFEVGRPTIDLSVPIDWRNYYDYGDPVGFQLDHASRWIEDNDWTSVFHLGQETGYDTGFSRYPLPGKAHVDYWTDDHVFGHFIENVVWRGAPPASLVPTHDGVPRETSAAGPPPSDYSKPPGDIRASQWVSYLLPNLGIAAIVALAAYILYKAVTAAIDPTGTTFGSAAVVASGVGGIAALILGITVAARIPRLTRSVVWRMVGLAAGVLGAALYLWSVAGFPRTTIAGRSLPPGSTTLALAVLVLPAAFILGWIRPWWGTRPLMISGAAAVALTVSLYLRDARGAVWPVLLAGAAFLYLWWLAALLFDLTFVWHFYIRHSKLVGRMDALAGQRPRARR